MNPSATPATAIYIGDITFDVDSPQRMAAFWATVLHYDIQTVSEEFAAIVHPEGKAPRCCFQKVITPKTGKNRMHLDLFVADMAVEVERLVALGARKVREARDGEVVWTVMLDVEGNEFCVQPPQW